MLHQYSSQGWPAQVWCTPISKVLLGCTKIMIVMSQMEFYLRIIGLLSHPHGKMIFSKNYIWAIVGLKKAKPMQEWQYFGQTWLKIFKRWFLAVKNAWNTRANKPMNANSRRPLITLAESCFRYFRAQKSKLSCGHWLLFKVHWGNFFTYNAAVSSRKPNFNRRSMFDSIRITCFKTYYQFDSCP